MIMYIWLGVTLLAHAAADDKLFYAPKEDDWVQQQILLYRQKHPKKDIAFGVSVPVSGYIIEINEYVYENGKKKRSNITIISPHLAASLQAVQAYKQQWQKIVSLASQHRKK